MKYTFQGDVVLVSGAGSGIGEATARLLAANGLRVVVSDIDAGTAGRVAGCRCDRPAPRRRPIRPLRDHLSARLRVDDLPPSRRIRRQPIGHRVENRGHRP